MGVMSLRDFGISMIRELIGSSAKIWWLGHNKILHQGNLKLTKIFFFLFHKKQQMNNNGYLKENITSTTKTIWEISDSSFDKTDAAVSYANGYTKHW